ncbi:vWA domain-containing protein [Paraburkholderia sp. GAS334]|uniref:vWA domain-containing protein n=1 Tax=Paraburkholderia sp. GAS334 TaxID=3035131 RepID=UPI003D1AEF13
MNLSRKRQQGSISMLVVISLIAVIAVLGLAIDSGFGYMIRTRLDAAADGAALAAGHAVTRGNTPAEQTTNAQQAAAAFFTANYPTNFLGSTATMNTPSIVFNAGTVTIDVQAQAQVPVSFMQLFGFRILNVSTHSQTIRKDLDMAFIVDVTGSMTTMPGEPAAVRANAISFLNNFDISNDRVALMHFAYGTIVDVPYKADSSRGFDRPGMTQAINHFSFKGSTNSSEAFWNARTQMDQLVNPSSLRVIVFFSDGAPNSFASQFANKVAACNNMVGTVVSGDGQSGTPTGFYRDDQISQSVGWPCSVGNVSNNFIKQLPAFYNAHNPNDQTFPIVTNSPRVVTNAVTYTNINRASRNLLEAMAENARANKIYVFTLGLGLELTQPAGPDNELGQDVLKCMANTSDAPARCYNAQEPVGVYCHAATPADLKPCYSQLASAILRIAK